MLTAVSLSTFLKPWCCCYTGWYMVNVDVCTVNYVLCGESCVRYGEGSGVQCTLCSTVKAVWSYDHV